MIIIGEKINGSIPKCGAAIAARDEEYIREMTRIQDQYGATYIDCCASVNENELETMKWMVDLIMQETDLPIALGILCCMGVIDQEALRDVCVFGELSLNGAVRPVRGALPDDREEMLSLLARLLD